MPTRRTFIAATLAGLAGLQHMNTVPNMPVVHADSSDTPWVFPDEGAPHARTWMAFCVTSSVWDWRPWVRRKVERSLASIANTIAAHEPVSMLVRSEDMDKAREMLDHGVELVGRPWTISGSGTLDRCL